MYHVQHKLQVYILYNRLSQYLQDSGQMMITIKTRKTIYIEDLYTICVKMTHKENLEESQNHF